MALVTEKPNLFALFHSPCCNCGQTRWCFSLPAKVKSMVGYNVISRPRHLDGETNELKSKAGKASALKRRGDKAYLQTETHQAPKKVKWD